MLHPEEFEINGLVTEADMSKKLFFFLTETCDVE